MKLNESFHLANLLIASHRACRSSTVQTAELAVAQFGRGLCPHQTPFTALPKASSRPRFSTQPPPTARCRHRQFHSTARLSSESRKINYYISASYSGKGNKLNPERNIYSYNPFLRLKKTATELQTGKRDPDRRPQSGQDAFFVSPVGGTEAVAFGVADGVGGWTESGIDPADFAHSLCDYMASAASNFPEGFKPGVLRPKDLLQSGYGRVEKDASILGGGSTACIAMAEPSGHMEVANLGDSGFIHLRPNAVRYFSSPQTHSFNTPYQLSKIPQKMLAQMALFDQARSFADMPKDANVTSHNIRHGDVLVFATDGVWDNLGPEDVLKIISQCMTAFGGWTHTANGVQVGEQLGALTRRRGDELSPMSTLQALLAVAITAKAKEASLDTRRDGPFAREVHKWFPGEDWHGGKPDDICVIAAVAVEDEASKAKPKL